MGSAYDLFDPISHTAAKGISVTARANRKQLLDAMAKGGFANYKREWWHYRFGGEPFKGRAFDFAIEKRATSEGTPSEKTPAASAKPRPEEKH